MSKLGNVRKIEKVMWPNIDIRVENEWVTLMTETIDQYDKPLLMKRSFKTTPISMDGFTKEVADFKHQVDIVTRR